MGIDAKTLAAARKYTDDSIAGGGISAGKNCVISSIAPITGGNRVTFQWTLDNGTVQTGTMDVMDGVTGAQGPQGPAGADGQDGADGLGIKSVAVNAQGHLIITYDDDTTEDAGEIHVTAAVDSVNGKTGDVELTASDVGALPDDTAIPSKISDLTNDSDFIETSATTGLVKNDGTIDTKTYVEVETGKGLSTNDYDNTAKAAVDGLSTALDGKVDKVTGKGLSTNDYDDTEKAKVAAAVTKAVNDLTNYYLKTETYTKTEVDNIAAAIKNSRFEVVSTLPTSDIHTNVIYLVPKASAQTSNAKDEYINLDGTTAGWEKIGDTEIDLSDYVTTTALNTALAAYTTTADLTTLLAGYIQKSNTAGLVKNDGSIDETSYATAASVTAITNGTTIDSFSDVETALSGKADTSDIPDITGKTDKVNGATNGNFAGLDANGNLTDSGKKAADFATPTNVSNLENRSTRLVKDTVGWTGKNLLKNTLLSVIGTSITRNGITFTINGGDGSVTANGTATATTYLGGGDGLVIDLDPGEYIWNGCPNGGSDRTYYCFSRTGDTTSAEFGKDYGNGKEFTLSETKTIYYFISIQNGQVCDNLKFYPMLRKADITDSTYEPYHDSVETMYEEEIHGVNLLKTTGGTKTVNGITFTNNKNGTWTINGTATANTYPILGWVNGGKLKAPTIISQGNVVDIGCRIYLNAYKNGTYTFNIMTATSGKSEEIVDIPSNDDYDSIAFGFNIPNGTTINNLTLKPMLRKAEIEDSIYRPYNHKSIQNQLDKHTTVLGSKNLLRNKAAATATVYGLTVTRNDDGTVTVDGTATGNAAIGINGNLLNELDPKETYIFSGAPITASEETYFTYVGYNPGNGSFGHEYGEGQEFSLSSLDITYQTVTYYIFVRTGSVLNNVVFKPMIRLASDPDDTYEPYSKTNRQLTYEGPIIKSYPVEWNEDLNVGTNKGGSIIQYGKLYFVTYWFKATTATTGNTGIIKLPKNGLTGGNYVITEDNDKAIWGGKATKDGVDYVSISCPTTVDKVYRAQCVWMDFT